MTEFNEIIKGHKTGAMITVLRGAVHKDTPRNILVVGCGSGLEAGDIARAFGARTIGIDTCDQFSFNHSAASPAKLMVMDARELEFSDASFDLVYSFHALEHIPTPARALAEMARILRPGGTYLLGTPNKRRLVGYIGAPTSLKNKVRWNLHDIRMRCAGKWSNEAGAHAGFSEAELLQLCASAFGGTPRAVSDDYYRFLYARKLRAVEALVTTGLNSILYPCVYVVGNKQATHRPYRPLPAIGMAGSIIEYYKMDT